MDNKATTTKEEEKAVAQATAVARYVHVSPRKTRLVVDLVRGRSVSEAIVILQNLNKRAAKPVLKVLLSALSNAENNFQMDKELLRISNIIVDQGPAIKRWRPRAYGRASMIRKPTSHISITLEEDKSLEGKSSDSFPVVLKREREAVEDEEAEKQIQSKPQIPQEKPTKGDKKEVKDKTSEGIISKGKKFIQRKGGER